MWKKLKDAADQKVKDEEVGLEIACCSRMSREALWQEWLQRQAEEDGALIDCGCCCSPFAFELLVQCSEGSARLHALPSTLSSSLFQALVLSRMPAEICGTDRVRRRPI